MTNSVAIQTRYFPREFIFEKSPTENFIFIDLSNNVAMRNSYRSNDLKN